MLDQLDPNLIENRAQITFRRWALQLFKWAQRKRGQSCMRMQEEDREWRKTALYNLRIAKRRRQWQRMNEENSSRPNLRISKWSSRQRHQIQRQPIQTKCFRGFTLRLEGRHNHTNIEYFEGRLLVRHLYGTNGSVPWMVEAQRYRFR